MTINQLINFLEITRQGSFTKAAQKMHISQPAISKCIQQLEKDLDATLFDRSSRKIKLTPEGKILHERGQVAMRIISDQMSFLYDSVQSNKGRIVMGVPPVMGTACFTSIIPQFRSLFPNIDITLVEEGANHILTKIMNGEIDVGAVMLPIEDADVHVIPFLTSENVLLVHKSHPFANRETVCFAELANEQFISLDSSYMLPNRMKNIFLNLGIQPNIKMESTQWDFIAEMVAGNQGVGILPRPILKRFKNDDLRYIRLVEPNFPWIVAIVVRNDKLIHGSLKLFIDYIKNYTL